MKKVLLPLLLLVSGVAVAQRHHVRYSQSKCCMHKEVCCFKPEFRFMAEAGLQTSNRYEFQTSLGAKVLPILYVGAGVGVYHDADATFTSIPLYGHLRLLHPTRGIVRPYVDVRAGYGGSVEDNFSGGFYWSNSVGLEVKRLYFGVGYSRQTYYHTNGNPNYGSRKGVRERCVGEGLTLRLGYSF